METQTIIQKFVTRENKFPVAEEIASKIVCVTRIPERRQRRNDSGSNKFLNSNIKYMFSSVNKYLCGRTSRFFQAAIKTRLMIWIQVAGWVEEKKESSVLRKVNFLSESTRISALELINRNIVENGKFKAEGEIALGKFKHKFVVFMKKLMILKMKI